MEIQFNTLLQKELTIHDIQRAMEDGKVNFKRTKLCITFIESQKV